MKKAALLCTSKSWGGLEMNVVKLANNLSVYGVDVVVITESDTIIAGKCKDAGMKVKIIPPHFKYFDLLSSRDIARYLSKNDVNNLFAFHSRDTDLASWVKVFYPSIQLIYQQHMHVGRTKKDYLHNLRYSRYDLWISPLHKLAQEVKDLTNFDFSKVKIIPIGVNVSKVINQNLTPDEAKSMTGLPMGKFIYGLIGRIDRQKGQLDVLMSFAECLKTDNNIHLLIAGSKTIGESEKYFSEIQTFISQNNLENSVTLLTGEFDVSTVYKSLDCFILASSSETYGMVTIEAMLNSLIIIATDKGGTTEILQDGKLGFLYKRGSIQQLCNLMIDVKNNYERYKTISESAKNYALDNFTDSIETNNVFNLLK